MEQTYEIFYTDKSGEAKSVLVVAKGQSMAIKKVKNLKGQDIRVTAIYNV